MGCLRAILGGLGTRLEPARFLLSIAVNLSLHLLANGEFFSPRILEAGKGHEDFQKLKKQLKNQVRILS